MKKVLIVLGIIGIGILVLLGVVALPLMFMDDTNHPILDVIIPCSCYFGFCAVGIEILVDKFRHF